MKKYVVFLLALIFVAASGINTNANCNCIDGRFIKNQQIQDFIARETLADINYGKRCGNSDYAVDKSRIIFLPFLGKNDIVEYVIVDVPILNIRQSGRIAKYVRSSLRLEVDISLYELARLLRYNNDFDKSFSYNLVEIGGFPEWFTDDQLHCYTEITDITEDKYQILSGQIEDYGKILKEEEMAKICEYSINFEKSRLLEIIPGEKIFFELW